jgi:hypothetical protein
MSVPESLFQRKCIPNSGLLFTQLKSIYSNSGYADDIYVRWTKEKRICSTKYFDRYFSYSVQEAYIPDSYFENLVKDFEDESIHKIVINLIRQ